MNSSIYSIQFIKSLDVRQKKTRDRSIPSNGKLGIALLILGFPAPHYDITETVSRQRKYCSVPGQPGYALFVFFLIIRHAMGIAEETDWKPNFRYFHTTYSVPCELTSFYPLNENDPILAAIRQFGNLNHLGRISF